MKFLATFILLFIVNIVFSQNLIPNPSFEDTIQCPDFHGQIDRTLYWYSPSNGTPDLLHTCSSNYDVTIPSNANGYQYPNQGDAYIGLRVYAGPINTILIEYIQVELTNQLEKNKEYLVEFYVSLADSSMWAVNNIGVYFSDNPFFIGTESYLNYIPQIINPSSNPLIDTMNWLLISDIYVAEGGEKYLTIGNFSDNLNSDTVFMGGPWGQAYYYLDDVSIILDTSTTIEENKENDILISKIYPNPNSGQLYLDYSLPEGKDGKLTIYSILGEKLEVYQLEYDVKTLIINTKLSNGLYYYKIVIDNKIIANEKFIIIK